MKKKVLSLLLVLVFLLGLLPTMALATDNTLNFSTNLNSEYTTSSGSPFCLSVAVGSYTPAGVEATPLPAGTTITYQWYKSTDDQIDASDSKVSTQQNYDFSPTAGKNWYYVTATATIEGIEYTATSNVACVKVPAAAESVKMTVSDQGILAADKDGKVMVERPVTVKDLNADGKLTMDEALTAAHTAYSTAAGYTASDSDYGLTVTKLWGTDTFNTLFFVNGEALQNGVGVDTVKAGDRLLASVNADDIYYADWYTAFDKASATVKAGEELTLTLTGGQGMGYPADLTKAVKGVKVGTWDNGTFTPIKGAVTDENGTVKLTFQAPGTYLVTANGTVSDSVDTDWDGTPDTTADCPIIAPACVVTVEEAFDPASLMYSDFRLYPSVAAYEADPDSYYPLTPAYDPNAEDQLHYSTVLPDYQNTVFGYRTIEGAIDPVSGEKVEYLTGVFEYNGYSYTTWSSSNGMMGAGWQGGASGVTNNYFISKPNMFGEGMYLDDYLSTTGVSKLANVRVSATRSASLKSLAIDGVWESAFDRADDTCSIYVDQASDGIDITATGYQTGYTITIGGTTEKSGTAIHVAYQWDENGEMAVPITVTPPETVNGYPAVASTYSVTLKQMPKGDKPVFMTQPKGGTYTLCPSDPAPSAMTVVASASGEMSYQWYKAEDAQGTNALPVEGATAASYAPVLTVAEDAYYFCRVTNAASGQSADSEAVLVKVYPDPTPTASLKTVAPALTVTECNGITFTETNGFFYYVGDTATPIEVEYSCPVEGASVTTQWWRGNMSLGADNGLMAITPATDVSAAKSSGGAKPGMYIYCTVKVTLNGRTYSADTEKIWVFVAASESNLIAPTVTTQPVSAEYELNAKNKRITVNIDYQTNFNAKYQWYVNTVNSNEGAVPVNANGTSTSYTLPTDTAGTFYYFCRITNSLQGFTKSADSEIAEINVKDPAAITLNGSGTEAEPYLISSVDELIELKRLVNEEGIDFTGLTVKLNADLTLTNETWIDSIGCTKDGTHDIKSGDNLRTFSGTFDGGNHTLTFDGTGTVKALFGYVHNTTIKNLNIQGTENVVFEDHALISTIEGVGLNDTAAIIDHVTLKAGTKTTKSGLAGGTMTTNPFAAASAGFKTTITNCTVEAGCVIGVNGDESCIGSFAGRLICEIENCVSYATVKGKNYVGGILGTSDNAMGPASVKNCVFHGEVIATGNNVGGIAGGGYSNDSAPNGGRILLLNNIVDGTVTGLRNVGGILGGDEYVAQSWGETRVSYNVFSGKVSGTENVGAIIGFYDSLNKFNEVKDNLYTADCGAEKGIAAVKYVDTNCENPTQISGTTYFNTETSVEDCPVVGGCNWRVAHNRTDDPLGADAEALCRVSETTGAVCYELVMEGTPKTVYYVGDTLDLSGLVFTAKWTQGKEDTTVDASELTVEGFDSSTRKVMDVTVKYGDTSTTFTVTVLNRPDPTVNTITVYFTLLGDTLHEGDNTIHTLTGGNLTTWIARESYEMDINATVKDLLGAVEKRHSNVKFNGKGSQYGTYVESVTYGDLTIGEFDNTATSGWMVTINGKHPDVGVDYEFLNNGDKVIFHFTDDYSKEQGSEEWNDPGTGDTPVSPSEPITEPTEQPSGEVKKREYSAESGKVPAIVNADGTKTIVKKSYADGKTAYALVPDGAKILFVDNRKSFADVKNGDWYADAIDFVTAHELFNGLGKDIFAPDMPMSRAMLVTVLYRLEDTPDCDVESAFRDVLIGDWYADAVLWAAANKITDGMGDGSFGADLDVTREQIATFLYRYAKYIGLDVSASGSLEAFPDGGKVSGWAQDAMKWAAGAGLFRGDNHGMLNPGKSATRAEVATLLMRLVERIVK